MLGVTHARCIPNVSGLTGYCPNDVHRSIETLPWIEKEYVDSGKVQMIFLDLPLWMHPDALQAAEAAQCAGDQGRFWEFHDELFANYSTFSPDDFGGYATDLELDVTAFAACLERGKLAGIGQSARHHGNTGLCPGSAHQEG